MSPPFPAVATKAAISAVVDRNAQLALIKAMTQKMLQLAKIQQWENVSKLEAERSDLIYTFFEVAPAVAEAESVAHTILEVLAADKEIIALSSSEQQNILQNSQKINRGKQASQAYASSHGYSD